MTSFSRLKAHHQLVNILIGIVVLSIALFWAWEFNHTLSGIAERQEEMLRAHQKQLLQTKSEELRDAFHEIYQSTRTISLLPMLRSVKGGNRNNEQEDVVAQGRLSLDTHLTLQQIYANLENNFNISEVYYVLDGFDPSRHVPFFMYDHLIAGDDRLAERQGQTRPMSPADTPEESEEEEYEYFPKQLEWFRRNAPTFIWDRSLDHIPVQLSPLMRTCDNTQYYSKQYGNVHETFGFIYAMPVYAQDNGAFKGMITTIIRANLLEAKLIGIPFLPLTSDDHARQAQEGWKIPGASPFRLELKEHGIDIKDRRNPVFEPSNISAALAQGRLEKISLNLHTGSPWELSHYLSPAEIDRLTMPFQKERRHVTAGRVGLLLLLLGAIAGASIMVVRSRRELMRLAHFDSLTELPNRRLFFDRLEQGIARARRNRRQLALFFVDIAGFNAINDAYGHQGGDLLLIGIAQRLQLALRGSDTIGPKDRPALLRVSRLGGDEFTIICEDLQNGEDVGAITNRLIETMHAPFEVGRGAVEIRLNMGIAVYPDDAQDSDKLLVCADNAMHECRQRGLTHFLFNDDLRNRIERLHLLSVELGRALELDQLELFYQPKASLANGAVVSFEALLRWRHPELGMISPVEFIPILERSGGIIEVGAWVLEQACRDMTRMNNLGFSGLKISVNVSVRQLRQGSFNTTAADILVRTGIQPGNLVLEITESLVMEDFNDTHKVLNELVELGFDLSIDDFGTGYSSLTYLQHLPLHYLKLDKAFIDGMSEPRAYHIVESVIYLAKGLNLVTIAEGIETEKQRDTMAALGCDIMQGYLLAKPMPFDMMIIWLREHS